MSKTLRKVKQFSETNWGQTKISRKEYRRSERRADKVAIRLELGEPLEMVDPTGEWAELEGETDRWDFLQDVLDFGEVSV